MERVFQDFSPEQAGEDHDRTEENHQPQDEGPVNQCVDDRQAAQRADCVIGYPRHLNHKTKRKEEDGSGPQHEGTKKTPASQSFSNLQAQNGPDLLPPVSPFRRQGRCKLIHHEWFPRPSPIR